MDREKVLAESNGEAEKALLESMKAAEKAAEFVDLIPPKDKVDTIYTILMNVQAKLIENRTQMIACYVLWQANKDSFEIQQQFVKSVDAYKHVVVDNAIFKKAMEKMTNSGEQQQQTHGRIISLADRGVNDD